MHTHQSSGLLEVENLFGPSPISLLSVGQCAGWSEPLLVACVFQIPSVEAEYINYCQYYMTLTQMAQTPIL